MIRGKTFFTNAVANIRPDVRRQVEWSMAIADRLAAILKERHMTQRDLAKVMHCTTPEVSRWLSGTHNFTLGTLARISAALNSDMIYV